MNINDMSNQMNEIYISDKSIENKVNEIETLVSHNWKTIVATHSAQIAKDFEKIGNEFKNVASTNINQELAAKVTDLSQFLLQCAKELKRPSVNDISNQINEIFTSDKPIETKVDQIYKLVTFNWKTIVTSHNAQIIKDFEKMGIEFKRVANKNNNAYELSEFLLWGTKEVKTPNLTSHENTVLFGLKNPDE